MLAPNEPIRLVVGLGNPGREYERTRHNAGFWFVDALARQAGKSLAMEKRYAGEAGRLTSDCWMLKPQTYMNRSGQAVGALAGFFQIPAGQILVVHDELDLKPGEVKLKLGGGVAGHNGLKDIRARLGTADFWRLRIGIGHPRDYELSQQEVVDFVLHRPGQEHQAEIDKVIAKCLEVWPMMAKGEMERAMHALHTKPKPPKPPRPAAPAAAGAPGVPAGPTNTTADDIPPAGTGADGGPSRQQP